MELARGEGTINILMTSSDVQRKLLIIRMGIGRLAVCTNRPNGVNYNIVKKLKFQIRIFL